MCSLNPNDRRATQQYDDAQARLTSSVKPIPPTWWILHLPQGQNDPYSASAGRGATGRFSAQSRLRVWRIAESCLIHMQMCITCLFKYDINVSGNKLGYLLPLCSLDRVVALLVFSKIL